MAARRRRSCSTGTTEPSEGLDDSNPPFYKWFADGRLNASANCLDRHVEAGRGERVAYHWRGEEGEERDVTYAELHRDVAALRQRAEGPRGREGRRGRDLPADDPRGRRRDARLRADRRRRTTSSSAASRPRRCASGWSSPRRRRWSPSTAPGARARPRRSSRPVDEQMGDLETLRDDRRRPPHRDRVPDERGPRRLLRRGAGGGRPGVPGRADGGRAPALHPLHLRLDREAEGDPAHDRRLHDRRHRDPPLRLRPEARVRTSTGARPTSAGSPATPTSSTGRSPTAPPA